MVILRYYLSLCFFVVWSFIGYGQDSTSTVPTNTPSSLERDIIISSLFKPTIREGAKILFKPNAFKALDSLAVGSYDYTLSFLPLVVSFPNQAATADQVGIFKQLQQKHKVQYVSLGYGMHQNLLAKAHLAWSKKEKGDVHFFGNYQQLLPSNDVYQRKYDANLGFMGRFFVKDRWQVSLGYNFNASDVQSAYKNEAISPQAITIPKNYHEVRLGVNNEHNPYNAKVYASPFIAYTRQTNQVKGLNKTFKEDGLLIRLPVSIILQPKLRLNLQAGYDWYHNQSTISPNASTTEKQNEIFRTSAAVQLTNSKMNGFLGLTVYSSEQYGLLIYPEAFLRYSFGKAGLFFVQARFSTKQYYQSLHIFQKKNPWIIDENALGNVLHISSQASFQYNMKDRFNARISLTWNLFRGINLITNSYENSYQLFTTLKEEGLHEIVLTNDYLYIVPEQYEIGLKLSRTFVAGMTTYEKPYGRYYPIAELYGVYHILPRLRLRGSFIAYDKVFYRDAQNTDKETTATYNLSLYLEYYMLSKKLRLWTQLENIINQRYERWNAYQHPGFIATLGASLYL